jgi:hypothetical protein
VWPAPNGHETETDVKKPKTLIPLLLIAALTACGNKDVSFETLETQRSIANDNGRYNAQKWRAENGFEKFNILGRGDSTQQSNCPQGDGWASVDLIDPQTKAPVVKLKCSTVSGNLGCYKEDDFKARSVLAQQENTCNTKIPQQLKKIEG